MTDTTSEHHSDTSAVHDTSADDSTLAVEDGEGIGAFTRRSVAPSSASRGFPDADAEAEWRRCRAQLPASTDDEDDEEEEEEEDEDETDDEVHVEGQGRSEDADNSADRSPQAGAIENLRVQERPTQVDRVGDIFDVPHQSAATLVTPVASSSESARGREYTLSLVSVPVQCTTTGGGLCEPPLIAQVMVKNTAASESGAAWVPAGSEILAEDDLPYLVASVSLWDAAGVTQIVPSSYRDRDAIRGNLTVSGQIYQDAEGLSRIFFVFPGLQITRPGSWKIGVSLIGLWTQDEADSRAHGAVVVGVLADTLTNAVTENSPLAVGMPQVDARTAALLLALADQGVQLQGSERSSIESQ